MKENEDFGSSGSEGGNIKTPSVTSKNDKEKENGSRISGRKRWLFTFNNYPDDWQQQMEKGLERCFWFCGEEIAPTTGTPHLQGYVEFPVKVRPIGYKGFPKQISWQACNGDRKDNLIYCNKESGKKYGNLIPPRKIVFPTFDKDWQIEVLEKIKEIPDDRTIHWYHGTGGIGKTTFCKYLVEKHGAIIVSGKGADVRNAVLTYLNDKGCYPELVLFPIPRSYNTDYLSYEALENIKDMFFYSGKYEGGQVCGPCPHLFIFSNEYPETEKISKDRWMIRYCE